jgi:hypothetical protein
LGAVFGGVVPAAGLEGDLAEAGGLAGEEELLLEAGEEELFEVVEVGGGVDEDGEVAAVEGVEAAVAVEELGDELGPGLADLAELGVALFDVLFEEGDEVGAEGGGVLAVDLLDLVEAFEVDFEAFFVGSVGHWVVLC